MTFSSRTVSVICKGCQQGLLEVHVDGKIYGPYQKIAHTRRGNEREDGWEDRETIFFHHLVDNEKGCHCFANRRELEPLTYYNVFSKRPSDDSYTEDEKVSCRIIWHKVYGFSDNELKRRFEFVCGNCKRKGDYESFKGSY